jgi:aminoglycoside phosphotransferase (APT) family kinase protein
MLATTNSTDNLQASLEIALSDHLGATVRIEGIERRGLPGRATHRLEEWDVSVAGGEPLHLVFKDLAQVAPQDQSRNGRPEFLYDPLREINVYQQVLAGGGLGTAACFGTLVDRDQGRYWLFLERVPGLELGRVSERAVWQQAARWLARLHTQLVRGPVRPSWTPHLLGYDEGFYWLWMSRAVVFAEANGAAEKSSLWGLRRLSESYASIAHRLASLPPTFIHGDFQASNVLVVRPGSGSNGQLRVCPVDWEMAAMGPGLIDLAALTADLADSDDRDAVAEAYYAALPDPARRGAGGQGWPPDWHSFQAALNCCRLHLALQRLGWSPDTSASTNGSRDWLGEALRLGAELVG